MISIIFNGNETRVRENTSLAAFLSENSMPSEKIALEIDGEIIPKSHYSKLLLQSGMKIEAVSFVGGG